MKISVLALALVSLAFVSPASAERVRATNLPAATCKEFPSSVFQPCICPDRVPKTIKYRPSVKECGGKAAAILFGEYASSYSVVLRDNQNRDRIPAHGYHGCSEKQVEDGLNRCSAYKCQKVLKVGSSSVGQGSQQICCFGEKGNSPILAAASRMTIKLRDDPSTTFDPLIRACLNKFDPTKKLN